MSVLEVRLRDVDSMEAVVGLAVVLHRVAHHGEHVLELGERLDVDPTATLVHDDMLLDKRLQQRLALVRCARSAHLRKKRSTPEKQLAMDFTRYFTRAEAILLVWQPT